MRRNEGAHKELGPSGKEGGYLTKRDQAPKLKKEEKLQKKGHKIYNKEWKCNKDMEKRFTTSEREREREKVE